MTLSARLRSIRQHLKLNQDAMTERFRLGVGAWKRLELEGRAPKGDVLAQLVEMGFSADWLLTGDGQMLRVAPSAAAALDDHLLGICIEAIDTELALAKRTLPSARKAAAISALYELLADEEGAARQPDHKVVQQFIKLAG